MVHESGYLSDTAQVYTGMLQAFGQSITAPQFHSVYRPTKFIIENDTIICPSFETIVKLCYLRGNMTLVIDEAHLLCTARSCLGMLMTANLIGRHRRLSLIYVAQSFSAITRPLTRNTDEFWFWRNIEPSDLDGIQERCGKDVRTAVSQLRKLEQPPEGVIPGEVLKWDIWNGVKQNEG